MGNNAEELEHIPVSNSLFTWLFPTLRSTDFRCIWMHLLEVTQKGNIRNRHDNRRQPVSVGNSWCKSTHEQSGKSRKSTQHWGNRNSTKTYSVNDRTNAPAHRGLQTHAQHPFFMLWKGQRLNLPRCRVLLQLKGLSGGLPQWRAAYEDAGNCELSQSETQHYHNVYWQ